MATNRGKCRPLNALPDGEKPLYLHISAGAHEAAAIPWRVLHRKVTKLYLAMRVIERFEEAEGQNPGEISIADLPGVLKLKKELCDAQSFNESHVPDALLERLVSDTSEFPPVCAILGGILGQVLITTRNSGHVLLLLT